MSANEQHLASLIYQKTEALSQAEDQLASSLTRLESALEGVQRSPIVPQRIYEYLEEAEERVEQLTQSLYAAMEAHGLMRRH